MFSLSSILNYVTKRVESYLPYNYQYFLITKVYTNWVLHFVYRGYKFLYRQVFQTHQLERILQVHSSQTISNNSFDETSSLNPTSQTISCMTILLVELYLVNSTIYKPLMAKVDKELMEVDTLLESIKLKKPSLKLDKVEEGRLKSSLVQLGLSRKLRSEVEFLRATPIDWNLKSHELKLRELFKNLNPEVELVERKSKLWKELGFQGIDPATDFRGVGLLGLEDLLYFSQSYPELAKELLARANDHPTRWYGFSIVGLHLTNFCVHLLTTNQLQYHLYSTNVHINNYHHIYCWLFGEFDKFWFDPNIDATSIQFEHLFTQFKNLISTHLYLLKPTTIN